MLIHFFHYNYQLIYAAVQLQLERSGCGLAYVAEYLVCSNFACTEKLAGNHPAAQYCYGGAA